MKSKLRYLISYNLKKNIKSKAFIVSNVIMLIILVLILNLDVIMKKVGGTKNYTLYVKSESELIKESFKAIYSKENDDVKIKNYEKSIDNFKDEIKNSKDKKVWLLEIKEDSKDLIRANIYSKYGVQDRDYQGISKSLNNLKTAMVLKNLNISSEDYKRLYTPVQLKTMETNTSKDTKNKIVGAIVFPLFVLPVFFLVVMVVNFVGASINEEKNTKAMEVIISCVDFKTHFKSKIYSANLFVLVQLLSFIVMFLISNIVRYLLTGETLFSRSIDGITIKKAFLLIKETSPEFLWSLPIFLGILVLTIFAYSVITSVFAAMTSSQEDYQKVIGPIMTTIMVGYYLSIMIPLFGEGTFLKIFGYIPLTSALVAPGLYAAGMFNIISLIISLLLLIIFIVVIMHYGSRAYKVGILNYESKDIFKKIFRAVGEKNK